MLSNANAVKAKKGKLRVKVKRKRTILASRAALPQAAGYQKCIILQYKFIIMRPIDVGIIRQAIFFSHVTSLFYFS